jgi:riboflavin kinase/FMN adenylyltransferase
MKVIHTPEELDSGSRKVCVAIGFFDGVHLGHQSILQRAKEDAGAVGGLSVAVTFDRHPNEIVAPARVPQLLYPLSKKVEVLHDAGMDAVCVFRFDKEFSQKTGEQFARELAAGFKRLESVSVGRTFTFGHKRSGDVKLLERVGEELNFRVHAIEEFAVEGEAVSSTRVRELVGEGDFEGAQRLLGRPYGLCATVVKGAGIGRQLGFPTANLDIKGLVTPPAAVYAAFAKIGGTKYRAAVNIGVRPTIDASAVNLVVEAHVLDFDANLVGRQLEIIFVKKLRGEHKFPSVEALKDQIRRDVAEARHLEG